jgi:hypothetical protein
MKIVSYIEVSQVEWNNICDLSDDAWLFHRYEWIKIEENFFVQSNYSFAILSDCGELIGIQPLYFHNLGFERLLDSGIHRHTGLALLNNLSPKQVKLARKLAMDHIKRLSSQIDADRIQLNSHNLAPKNLSAQREEIPFWVDEDSFYLGLYFTGTGFVPVPGMRSCSADQIVHLKNANTEELFQGLHDSCQRAVKKAIKNGLEIEFADAPSHIDSYYKIAQLSSERTGEVLPSIDYFKNIFDEFYAKERCRLVFALYEGQRIGALFLLIYKQSISFMTGVSDPSFLALRVNDFIHWEVIKWGSSEGYHTYRLGPYFPEISKDSPVEKVSRFKKKFGGHNTTIIEGSYFCKPEKYMQNGINEIEFLCKPKELLVNELNKAELKLPKKIVFLGNQNETSIKIILRSYGLLTLPFQISNNDFLLGSQTDVVFVSEKSDLSDFGVQISLRLEKEIFYRSQVRKTWNPFKSIKPIYHALLPHITFSGGNLEPIWVNEKGQAVIAWLKHQDKKILLIGLNVVEEIIRHRQGDPSQVALNKQKSDPLYNVERPYYLFQDQINQNYRTHPWADYLGFFLAETFSQLSGYPLIEILPRGAKGLVVLTGDDDQAFLGKYDDQLRLIGDLPITYFLHPLTRHTPETIANLPRNVELGVHPDAIDSPDDYDELCTLQTEQIRKLTGSAVRTVRNHCLQNRGYLGHLPIWEQNGLFLDVNLPGIDGCALNGSFLPMRIRRPDQSWSSNYSLLTTFNDSLVYSHLPYLLNLSEKEAIKRIRKVLRQVENSNYPSVMVFSFHPQNIDNLRELHLEVLRLSLRSGWIPIGLETYLDWLQKLEHLYLKVDNGQFSLISDQPVEGLAVRYPIQNGWKKQELPAWSKQIQLASNI